MFIIAKEILQYEKNYIKYYINVPKICYEESINKDLLKIEMIESVNRTIFEDIITFMDTMEDNYHIGSLNYTNLSNLTEFQIGYNSKDLISLSLEFSQLNGFYDISYLKGYNYDFKLRKEILLKDLFNENVDYIKILKKYILVEFKKLIIEFEDYMSELANNICEDSIFINEANIFYFTDEYLILPFSSCEIDKEFLNLVEFKIPFNTIYNYLSDYIIENVVKKIIL